MPALKRLLRKEWVSRLIDGLLPVFATLAALGVGAIILLFLGVNPIEAYSALLQGAFGSANAFAETLVKATPLLLVAIGICISFRGDVINIGGEGQMIIGALLATWVGLTFTGLPGWVVITLAILAGFVGGALWGGLAGYLKAYFNVNEILSTVMMNAIAVQLMNYLLRGPMIDPSQAQLASKIPQTARLLEIFRLPRLAAHPFASGSFDRCWAGDPRIHPVVAHNSGLSHPGCGAKPTCLPLCGDQGPTVCCPCPAAEWGIRGAGRNKSMSMA